MLATLSNGRTKYTLAKPINTRIINWPTLANRLYALLQTFKITEMIYKTDYGSYVISSGGMWLPGAYEDERTAKYAFRFSDVDLIKLQEEKNKTTSLITFKDLQELRKSNK